MRPQVNLRPYHDTGLAAHGEWKKYPKIGHIHREVNYSVYILEFKDSLGPCFTDTGQILGYLWAVTLQSWMVVKGNVFWIYTASSTTLGAAAVTVSPCSGARLSPFAPSFCHLMGLEKAVATHCSVLAWRIPGTGEPGGLPSVGSHRVGHNWSDLAAAAGVGPWKGI